MWFFLLIISIVFFYILSNYTCKRKYFNTGINNSYYKNDSISLYDVLILIYFFLLTIIAGLRSGIGDTGYYMRNFNIYSNISVFDLSYIFSKKEPGFVLLNVLISKIYDHPQFFLFIISVVTMGFIFKRIYKSSEDIGLSLFLWVSAGFLLGTMNGLRQYIVVAVLFYFGENIINKKPTIYIIITILLSTIHTSALFIIPIYFIVKKQAWKISTFIILIIFAFACLNFSYIMSSFGDVLDNTVYGNYTDSLSTDSDAGANLIRVLVMYVPVVLSFMARNKIRDDDREYHFYSNMIILNAAFYSLAAINWIFARIAMYFHIYLLLFYPMIINRLFTDKDKTIVKLFIILFYSVYFLYEVRNTPYLSYYLNINTDLIGPLTITFY